MRTIYKEVPRFRRFGVEIEVSPTHSKSDIALFLDQYEKHMGIGRPVKETDPKKGWAETKENDYWHVKYDSSCGPTGVKGIDHGWEIASYIAMGHKDIHNIAQAATWLSLYLETNKNCGLHIHVDVADLSPADMGRILMAWISVEDALFAIAHPCRSESYFCRPLRGRFLDKLIDGSLYAMNPNNPRCFWDLMKPTDFSTHNNPDKKYALNTVGFAMGQIVPSHSRKTIELRLPECKLSGSHILGWTSLFLNFVNTACRISPTYPITQSANIDDLLFRLGLAGRESFFLPGPMLLGTKKWFLKNLSKADYFMRNAASNRLEFMTRI